MCRSEGAHGSPEEELDPLELQLQVACEPPDDAMRLLRSTTNKNLVPLQEREGTLLAGRVGREFKPGFPYIVLAVLELVLLKAQIHFHLLQEHS